jgi:glutathione S-transferase
MPLEIYLDPCTINCRKVLAGLDLLDVPYEYHYINYFEGEQKSADFVKINPNATIPAATDGDLTLTESNAILQYAADLSSNHTAYPNDIKKRADVNRWLLWEASVWFQSCYIYLVEYVVKPLLKAEPDPSVIEAAAPKWNQLAKILDEQLGKTKFISGPDVTIADIAIASPMHLHAASRLPMDKYPNLSRWIKDIEAVPAWQKTQPAVEKALLPNGKPSTSTASNTNGAATANGATAAHPNGHNDHPKEVQSTLNYTKDLNDQLTELYFYEDPEGKHTRIHEPGDDAQKVTIRDGRGLKDEFSVDKHGFAFREFRSEYAGSWEDEEKVRSEFYPEVVEFLMRTTGASRILVFDHTIRTKGNQAKKLTQETNTSQRAPVRLVHCDYTAESGPVRVQQLLPSESSDLLSRRVAFLNVWKPLAKVEEMPLAMCDVTSSPPEDFFKLFLRYRDRTGENYVMKYSPEHKWYYFPDMMEEQVILLKTFDSEEGKARFVGHSAFEDPTSREGAPYRESIEIRTIAFF